MLGNTDKPVERKNGVGQGRNWQWSLAGVGVVLRQRMRRHARRDLVWAGLLLVGLLGISGWLQVQPFRPDIRGSLCGCSLDGLGDARVLRFRLAFFLFGVPDYYLRWLLMYALGASLVLMPVAGVLGAHAVPRSEETGAVQAALLTRLRAGDICLGRLIAALWPLIAAMGVSCAFWLCLEAGTRFLPDRLAGGEQILAAHVVLLCGTGMAGSIGFVFASRSRPGAMWGRGALMAFLVTVVSLGGIVLDDPLVQRMDNPVPLINAALLFNPVSVLAPVFKVDLLRTRWLYAHTSATEYPFHYPSEWAGIGVSLLISLLCMQAAAMLMRRAYRL
jgi:hypothetical protein